MVFTTIAYTESKDSAVLVNVAPVPDDHVTVVAGDSILVPKVTFKLAAALGLGVNITLARVASPSLEAFNLIDIAPLNVGVEPLSNTPFMHFFESPIPLVVDESLRFQAAEDGVGAQINYGILWLMDKLEPLPVVNGQRLPIRSIRFTSGTTLVAGLWTDCPLVAIQTLKAGRYALVGARLVTATGIAGRIKFIGEKADHRPGFIAYDAVEDFENPLFRMGRLGVWGEFEHNQIPIIQALALAGDTVQEIILDVIKIA